MVKQFPTLKHIKENYDEKDLPSALVTALWSCVLTERRFSQALERDAQDIYEEIVKVCCSNTIKERFGNATESLSQQNPTGPGCAPYECNVFEAKGEAWLANIVLAALELPYFFGAAKQTQVDRLKEFREELEKVTKPWLHKYDEAFETA